VAHHRGADGAARGLSRRGAYAESCLATERARGAGLSVGCNVFLTRDSLPQLEELIGVVGRLADEGACFETPGFLPTPRSRHLERRRLTLPDLAPWAARLGELANPVCRSLWADLETRTVAAWVRRALADDWPDSPARAPGELALVCRPSFDVYSGLAGLYRTRHGNLRTDGVAAVRGRALERGRERDDELWFGPGPLPAPDELAARYGDADGLGVHMDPESARYLWLDRYRG
jgi:hypothetical protein